MVVKQVCKHTAVIGCCEKKLQVYKLFTLFREKLPLKPWIIQEQIIEFMLQDSQMALTNIKVITCAGFEPSAFS
jgi:hypothetical protein